MRIQDGFTRLLVVSLSRLDFLGAEVEEKVGKNWKGGLARMNNLRCPDVRRIIPKLQLLSQSLVESKCGALCTVVVHDLCHCHIASTELVQI